MRSWLALGFSVAAFGCSAMALLIVLGQSETEIPGVGGSVAPEQHTRSMQIESEEEPVDPAQAFQAQLARNEELLLQLRRGELTPSGDQ